MERYAWSARIVPGMKAEYCRRHDEIWPELVELLRAAGIKNYTIWNTGDLLFGYYECERGVKYAADMQKNSPIVKKWDEYMKDVLIMEMDEKTGAQPLLECVFTLE